MAKRPGHKKRRRGQVGEQLFFPVKGMRKNRRRGRKRLGRPRTSRFVMHRTRQRFCRARPVGITIRVTERVWSLRRHKLYPVVRRVFCQVAQRPGFRICHFSVMSNHIHLIVEAKDRDALTNAMRRLGIRLALHINKRMGAKKGRVYADRYHERPLGSPAEVKNALGYVLCNYRRHSDSRVPPHWLDPCSSGEFFDGWRGRPRPLQPQRGDPVRPPRTWLLSQGWRRRGLISPDLVPGTTRSG